MKATWIGEGTFVRVLDLFAKESDEVFDTHVASLCL